MQIITKLKNLSPFRIIINSQLTFKVIDLHQMQEINPITQKISDLKLRTAELRGYL